MIEIPSPDEQGFDIDYLEKLCGKFDITACVVMPNFSTPTGLSLSKYKRSKLIELANQFNYYIIEDDIYGEMGFIKNNPPLISQNAQNNIILCGSVSKSLSKDLRIGWLISPSLSKQFVKSKLTTQLAGSRSSQAGLAEFMAKGLYRKHLNHFLKYLMAQRNILLSELRSFWPNDIEYHIPEGGLTIWVKLNASANTTILYNLLIKKNRHYTRDLVCYRSAIF